MGWIPLEACHQLSYEPSALMKATPIFGNYYAYKSSFVLTSSVRDILVKKICLPYQIKNKMLILIKSISLYNFITCDMNLANLANSSKEILYDIVQVKRLGYEKDAI